MKWFKHYTDASLDSKICELEQEFGYVGYGVYWKILETCALQWDGISDPVFKINKKKMKSILSLNYKKTQSILSLLSVLNLFYVEISENFYEIRIDNLLKIKDNHTRNLQVSGNKVSENLPLDKIRTDKKRKEIKKKSSKQCVRFDFDLIYAAYPKKQGKAAGLKKLKSLVKEKSQYEKILAGAKLYSDYVRVNKIEMKFVKQFSTWVNQECWNDELEKPYTEEDWEKDFLNFLETKAVQ